MASPALHRRIRLSSFLVGAAVLAGCGRSNPAPAGATTSVPEAATTSVPEVRTSVPGSAANETPAGGPWQEGPAALEKALAARAVCRHGAASGPEPRRAACAPILLYVSSEWCPPCRALEANLLSKQAFFDAAKGFVLVRIDGDSEGAQAIAERYEARAYPTLLLLGADGQEVFRAHHAVTLDELRPALASAAATGRGFTDALGRLEKTAATAEDCALLAAVDWSPASGMTLSTEERLRALQRAFAQCAASPGPLRALLASQLLGLAATADNLADSALPGASTRPLTGALLDAIFQDDETAFAARTLVTTWANPVVRWLFGDARGPDFVALRDRWLRAARAIRTRPGVSIDMQLLGYNAELDFHRLEHGDSAPVPATLHDEIATLVGRVLDLAQTPAERHAVVSNAAYLLRSIGERARARDVLESEIRRTDSPSYYQTTLSQWALQEGRRDEARRFARAAVLSARGRPSQLQWRIDELALYSAETPEDRPIMLARGAEAYALLFAGDDAFLGRNRARAARLHDMLSPLSGEPALTALVAMYAPRCASFPAESRAVCEAHFTALTAPPAGR